MILILLMTNLSIIISATPFCYLYDDPIKLYFTFRAFYTRYWHRLHTISTHPQVCIINNLGGRYDKLIYYTFVLLNYYLNYTTIHMFCLLNKLSI